MTELAAKIEALLFLSTRPVSFKKLAKMLDRTVEDVENGLKDLSETRNIAESGIHLIIANGAAELATNPAFSDIVLGMRKEETTADLTRPQLETLTIIAYRGPITRPDIEYIRGVNCTVILRNLLMRGLVIEKEDASRILPVYTLSTEMLRHLGIHSLEELPDYKELHTHAKISQMLDSLGDETKEE
jgi:segregation and condensation protein B